MAKSFYACTWLLANLYIYYLPEKVTIDNDMHYGDCLS